MAGMGKKNIYESNDLFKYEKLHARAENLCSSPVYILDFYPSTKTFLGPTWDLEIGLIVLGEDLAICQWIKF
jgi:hypothetical protein